MLVSVKYYSFLGTSFKNLAIVVAGRKEGPRLQAEHPAHNEDNSASWRFCWFTFDLLLLSSFAALAILDLPKMGMMLAAPMLKDLGTSVKTRCSWMTVMTSRVCVVWSSQI